MPVSKPNQGVYWNVTATPDNWTIHVEVTHQGQDYQVDSNSQYKGKDVYRKSHSAKTQREAQGIVRQMVFEASLTLVAAMWDSESLDAFTFALQAAKVGYFLLRFLMAMEWTNLKDFLLESGSLLLEAA